MSTNLPEQQPSEEIDLGQLFKLIGNAFDRFFRFIGSIFNKFFLAFVWIVFFTKKHFIKLTIAGIVGVLIGVIKQKTDDPIYESTIIIKQNYNTGEHLYNTLSHYNLLINERDSVTLGEILNIETNEANNLKEFEIESILSENQKLQLFNDYAKDLDSVLAEEIEFKDFLDNSKEYEHKFQRIKLSSSSKRNFEKVFTKVIDNISSNVFFKNEQQKDLNELDGRKRIIEQSLLESDSLQKVYQNVLEKSAEKVAGGATSITFEGADDKSVTKEFELFQSDLTLRKELVEIERDKEDLAQIIEIISSQQDIGTLNNKGQLFSLEVNAIISYCVKLILLIYSILLLIEFLKLLERYKDKV